MGATASSVCAASRYSESGEVPAIKAAEPQPRHSKTGQLPPLRSKSVPNANPEVPEASRSARSPSHNSAAMRRRITRLSKGGAWALATGRIHAMNNQLIQLRCANGDLVTTPDTISKAPRFADPHATTNSDKHVIAIILDSLRKGDGRLVVPEDFSQWLDLKAELQRFGLTRLSDEASPQSITISCQAALSTGRLNPEVTFRKVVRIVVCGRVAICRDVFEDQLNEARDGDAAEDKYTSRFYLKHAQLERAFDTLAMKGFRMVGSSTFAPSLLPPNKDEATFVHHTQFVFVRHPGQTPVFRETAAA